jgi:hypothetical protein
MSWPFEDADKEVVDCYLDTDLDVSYLLIVDG